MSRLLKATGAVAALIIAFVLIYNSIFFIMKQIYPCKYQEIVVSEAANNNLDIYLLYSVIKSESGFDPDAVSPAGAVGLMQLMPSTFSYLQKCLNGNIELDEDDLKNPQVNIHYGAYYLRSLLNKYDGDEELAVCAYNAGMGNVDLWLDSPEHSPDGKDLDNIPYRETRNYVSQVIRTKDMYYRLYSKE